MGNKLIFEWWYKTRPSRSRRSKSWTIAKQFPLGGLIFGSFWIKSQLERVTYYWLLIGWLFIIFSKKGKHYRRDTFKNWGQFYIIYRVAKSGGIVFITFGSLYIVPTLCKYLYLYIENTLSIYRKVALGFCSFYSLQQEAYTF